MPAKTHLNHLPAKLEPKTVLTKFKKLNLSINRDFQDNK